MVGQDQQDDDDRREDPDLWADASEYSPRGDGAFWVGTGSDGAALRGWWIRQLYHAAKEHAPDARRGERS